MMTYRVGIFHTSRQPYNNFEERFMRAVLRLKSAIMRLKLPVL